MNPFILYQEYRHLRWIVIMLLCGHTFFQEKNETILFVVFYFGEFSMDFWIEWRNKISIDRVKFFENRQWFLINKQKQRLTYYSFQKKSLDEIFLCLSNVNDQSNKGRISKHNFWSFNAWNQPIGYLKIFLFSKVLNQWETASCIILNS
jgi:hypothetical protein